jgi:hypothetical protein
MESGRGKGREAANSPRSPRLSSSSTEQHSSFTFPVNHPNTYGLSDLPQKLMQHNQSFQVLVTTPSAPTAAAAVGGGIKGVTVAAANAPTAVTAACEGLHNSLVTLSNHESRNSDYQIVSQTYKKAKFAV